MAPHDAPFASATATSGDSRKGGGGGSSSSNNGLGKQLSATTTLTFTMNASAVNEFTNADELFFVVPESEQFGKQSRQSCVYILLELLHK